MPITSFNIIRGALLSLLLIMTCACAQSTTLVFTEYGSSAYSQKSIQSYQKLLKEAHLKKADILYTCYVKNSDDHNIDCSSYDSPHLSRIQKLAKKLKSQDIAITLRFYVDLKDQKWRAYWHPKKISLAFTNLESQLKKFAVLANKIKADQLIIGSEYEALTHKKYQKNWEKIIATIRSVYSGALLYAANGNINKSDKPEYTWVPFWPLLDKVGINYYPPFKGKINSPHFPKKLKEHHQKNLKKISSFATSQGKELAITEVGFPLAKKGIYTPYEWRYSKRDKPSAALRDQSLSIFLKEAKKLKVSSLHLWRYLPREKKAHPLGYIIDSSFIKTLKAR